MSDHRLGSASGQNMGHCIALWYSRKHVLPGHGPQPELKLHVNLWRLDSKLNGVDMTALDLGFQVSKATSVASVHLFVPFPVDRNSITDLGEKLTDADMAIAIFNEDAKVTGSPKNQSSFSIRLGNVDLSCWKLEPNSELKFEEVTNSSSQARAPAGRATVITFDPKVFAVESDEVERYVRLRISLPSEADGAFFKRYDPVDRRFLSGFDEIEVVDFRFNEARNLPRDVIERMDSIFRISEINYFVIRDITDDLTLSHSQLKKCRTLESSVWSKYVQEGQATARPLRNAIIFYWQKLSEASGSIKDYNALARFQRRKTDLPAIGWFVLSTLGIGIIAGLISGGVVTYFTPIPAALPSENHTPPAQAVPNKTEPSLRSIPTEKPPTPG